MLFTIPSSVPIRKDPMNFAWCDTDDGGIALLYLSDETLAKVFFRRVTFVDGEPVFGTEYHVDTLPVACAITMIRITEVATNRFALVLPASATARATPFGDFVAGELVYNVNIKYLINAGTNPSIAYTYNISRLAGHNLAPLDCVAFHDGEFYCHEYTWVRTTATTGNVVSVRVYRFFMTATTITNVSSGSYTGSQGGVMNRITLSSKKIRDFTGRTLVGWSLTHPVSAINGVSELGPFYVLMAMRSIMYIYASGDAYKTNLGSVWSQFTNGTGNNNGYPTAWGMADLSLGYQRRTTANLGGLNVQRGEVNEYYSSGAVTSISLINDFADICRLGINESGNSIMVGLEMLNHRGFDANYMNSARAIIGGLNTDLSDVVLSTLDNTQNNIHRRTITPYKYREYHHGPYFALKPIGSKVAVIACLTDSNDPAPSIAMIDLEGVIPAVTRVAQNAAVKHNVKTDVDSIAQNIANEGSMQTFLTRIAQNITNKHRATTNVDRITQNAAIQSPRPITGIQFLDAALIYQETVKTSRITQMVQNVLVQDTNANTQVTQQSQQLLTKDTIANTHITQLAQAIGVSEPIAFTRITQLAQLVTLTDKYSFKRVTQLAQALCIKYDPSIFYMAFNPLERPTPDEFYTSNTKRATSVGPNVYIQLEGDILDGSYIIKNGENVGLTTTVESGDLIAIYSGVNNYYTISIRLYKYEIINGNLQRDVVGYWPVIQPDLSPIIQREHSNLRYAGRNGTVQEEHAPNASQRTGTCQQQPLHVFAMAADYTQYRYHVAQRLPKINISSVHTAHLTPTVQQSKRHLVVLQADVSQLRYHTFNITPTLYPSPTLKTFNKSAQLGFFYNHLSDTFKGFVAKTAVHAMMDNQHWISSPASTLKGTSARYIQGTTNLQSAETQYLWGFTMVSNTNYLTTAFQDRTYESDQTYLLHGRLILDTQHLGLAHHYHVYEADQLYTHQQPLTQNVEQHYLHQQDTPLDSSQEWVHQQIYTLNVDQVFINQAPVLKEALQTWVNNTYYIHEIGQTWEHQQTVTKYANQVWLRHQPLVQQISYAWLLNVTRGHFTDMEFETYTPTLKQGAHQTKVHQPTHPVVSRTAAINQDGVRTAEHQPIISHLHYVTRQYTWINYGQNWDNPLPLTYHMGFNSQNEAQDYAQNYEGVTLIQRYNGYVFTVDYASTLDCTTRSIFAIKWLLQGG